MGCRAFVGSLSFCVIGCAALSVVPFLLLRDISRFPDPLFVGRVFKHSIHACYKDRHFSFRGKLAVQGRSEKVKRCPSARLIR